MNGLSIRDFSTIANTALGGGTTPYTIQDLWLTAFDINNSFSNGVVSAFAALHLANGSCPLLSAVDLRLGPFGRRLD